MPKLGNALDFSQFEGKQFRAHQLGGDPSTPVSGQLYFNNVNNTLWWWDGSAWVSARGGASATPPATTSALGTIQLAGDLAGTATSPQIAAGVITDADVNAANKDGAVGTPSLRTIGGGAQQAMAGNTKLNALAVNGNLDMGGYGITNMADPTNSGDAATKFYVDAVAQGLDTKQSVKASSVANLTLSGAQTVDGISLVAGDRVLIKDQTTPSQNGIYIVQVGAWGRSLDADSWGELPGAYTFVEMGTQNADSGWTCTSDQGGTLNTTAVTWTQFSGAGSITAGQGLTKTGNIIDVGAGAGIQVNVDSIQIANDGITAAMVGPSSVSLTTDVTGTLPITQGGTGQTTSKTARETGLTAAGYYSSATHGAGASISILASTHGLRATRGLIVQAQFESDGSVVLPDIVVAANGDVTVTFGASQAANSIRLTIIG